MVESSGLLNRRRRLKLYRGFESPPLRQIRYDRPIVYACPDVLKDSSRCGHDYASRTITDHGAGAFKGYAAGDVRSADSSSPSDIAIDSMLRDLPGRPDIVFRKRVARSFSVHGCFWHRHAACRCSRVYLNRGRDFWIPEAGRKTGKGTTRTEKRYCVKDGRCDDNLGMPDCQASNLLLGDR